MWRRVLRVNVSEVDENKTKIYPVQSTTGCGGVEVEFYSFLTSVLDGSV